MMRKRPRDEAQLELEPCLLVDSGGFAIVFPQPRDAEGWMEIVDVLAGEYSAFNANGDCLSIDVLGERIVMSLSGTYSPAIAIAAMQKSGYMTDRESDLSSAVHRIAEQGGTYTS